MQMRSGGDGFSYMFANDDIQAMPNDDDEDSAIGALQKMVITYATEDQTSA